MVLANNDRQLPLFGPGIPAKVGHAYVESVNTSSILTKASGFMADYDYTLNPYSGCSFGCTYCYAAFFARDAVLRDNWGYWVKVKRNAVDRLRRMRTSLRGKTIYMSSVTDPYQPIEKQVELVRGLLEALVEYQPRLVVQTRSSLVARDIDLLERFEAVRVNMTITTDSERVRKSFEPMCPSNAQRVDAITEVCAAGIATAITMTPLLPLENPKQFAEHLRETGVPRFVVQPFHPERGKFIRGTRDAAMEILRDMDWSCERYREAVEVLRACLPHLDEGREGFMPA